MISDGKSVIVAPRSVSCQCRFSFNGFMSISLFSKLKNVSKCQSVFAVLPGVGTERAILGH